MKLNLRALDDYTRESRWAVVETMNGRAATWWRYNRVTLPLTLLLGIFAGSVFYEALTGALASSVARERAAWEAAIFARCVPTERGAQARMVVGPDGVVRCTRYGPKTAPDGWQEPLKQTLLRQALSREGS